MKQPTIADKKVTKYILQRFGLHMSKRLGQNFLIDAGIVQGIVDAADIQRQAYKHNQNVRHTTYTPPYLELAAQLLVDEDQIFRAAASHLTLIAKSRRKYAPEIKAVFAEVIAGRKLSPEKIAYLSKKLEEI